MSRAPRATLPPTAYGSRLHDAIREGTTRQVTLQCPGERGADGSIRLLQRINSLRRAMRKANHPDADRYYGAHAIRIRNLVILIPSDSQYDPIIDNAGVPRPATEEAPTPSPTAGADPKEIFLKQMQEELENLDKLQKRS